LWLVRCEDGVCPVLDFGRRLAPCGRDLDSRSWPARARGRKLTARRQPRDRSHLHGCHEEVQAALSGAARRSIIYSGNSSRGFRPDSAQTVHSCRASPPAIELYWLENKSSHVSLAAPVGLYARAVVHGRPDTRTLPLSPTTCSARTSPSTILRHRPPVTRS
jgi:hypothetical protein